MSSAQAGDQALPAAPGRLQLLLMLLLPVLAWLAQYHQAMSLLAGGKAGATCSASAKRHFVEWLCKQGLTTRLWDPGRKLQR